MAERCPTCGARVRIVGDVTLHYEPAPQPTIDPTPEALARADELAEAVELILGQVGGVLLTARGIGRARLQSVLTAYQAAREGSRDNG